MSDTEFLKEAALACGICGILLSIYLSGGLMAVIVTATLVDCAVRRIETLRERRARALATAETPRPHGM